MDGIQFLVNRDPDLSTLRSPLLGQLHEFWLALKMDDRLPARSDFQPNHIPLRLLPHIALIDVFRDGGDLRLSWRLVGPHITGSTGRDVTGRYFDELYAGADREDLMAAYVWLATNGRPLRWHGNSEFVNKDWLKFECAGFPLASDGQTVDKLLIGMVFARDPIGRRM